MKCLQVGAYMESRVEGQRPREGIFCPGVVEGRKDQDHSWGDDLHHFNVLQFCCSGTICLNIKCSMDIITRQYRHSNDLALHTQKDRTRQNVQTKQKKNTDSKTQ